MLEFILLLLKSTKIPLFANLPETMTAPQSFRQSIGENCFSHSKKRLHSLILSIFPSIFRTITLPYLCPGFSPEGWSENFPGNVAKAHHFLSQFREIQACSGFPVWQATYFSFHTKVTFKPQCKTIFSLSLARHLNLPLFRHVLCH